MEVGGVPCRLGAGGDPGPARAAYDVRSAGERLSALHAGRQPATAEQLAFFLDYPRTPGLLDRRGTACHGPVRAPAPAPSWGRDFPAVADHFQHRGAGQHLISTGPAVTGRIRGVDGQCSARTSNAVAEGLGLPMTLSDGAEMVFMNGSGRPERWTFSLRPRENVPSLAPVLRSACYPLENNHGAVNQTYRDLVPASAGSVSRTLPMACGRTQGDVARRLCTGIPELVQRFSQRKTPSVAAGRVINPAHYAPGPPRRHCGTRDPDHPEHLTACERRQLKISSTCRPLAGSDRVIEWRGMPSGRAPLCHLPAAAPRSGFGSHRG